MNTRLHPLLGAQMLLVAFGALVLVPILTGLNPNVALFTAGAGTLLFQLVTGRQVPVFLGSSFVFIAPITIGIQKWGLPGTLSGLFASGMVYVALSFLVRWKGTSLFKRLLPPVVTGPVIMVIGLGLAPVAVNMAMGKTGDGSIQLIPSETALLISLSSLAVTLCIATLSRGLLRLLPILIGLTSGYLLSLSLGLVDWTPIQQAPWFAFPAFVCPEWNWEAILYLLPISIAPAIEHMGDVVAISRSTGQNYIQRPGLHRTLLGDGLATSLAAFLGGPPNTTYSEVIGAVKLTKAHDPRIMTWACLWAIFLSFNAKLGAFLQTIPVPVMGGIMILLFGTIAVVGLSTLSHAEADLEHPRNLAIVAISLVMGLGGMHLGYKQFILEGMGLSAMVAIVLHLLLPKRSEEQQPLAI